MKKIFNEIRELGKKAKVENKNEGLFIFVVYDNNKKGYDREVIAYTEDIGKVDGEAMEKVLSQLLTFQMQQNNPERFEEIKKKINDKKNKHGSKGKLLPE